MPPRGVPREHLIDLYHLPDIASQHVAADGTDVVIGLGQRIVRLHWDPNVERWGGIILPNEPQASFRYEASMWLVRYLDGKARGASPEGLRMTDRRLAHFTFLLRLFDGHMAGAKQKELGALVDPEIAGLSAAAFDDSSERKYIRRCLSQVRRLVAGEYRSLLSGSYLFTPRKAAGPLLAGSTAGEG